MTYGVGLQRYFESVTDVDNKRDDSICCSVFFSSPENDDDDDGIEGETTQRIRKQLLVFLSKCILVSVAQTKSEENVETFPFVR